MTGISRIGASARAAIVDAVVGENNGSPTPLPSLPSIKSGEIWARPKPFWTERTKPQVELYDLPASAADAVPDNVTLLEGLAEPPGDSRSSALLELIATPAAICDQNCVVLTSNVLMSAILRTQDGLFTQGGVLKCAVGVESTVLHKTIRNFAAIEREDALREKSQILRISRSVSAEPLIVVISPLNTRSGEHKSREVLLRIVATGHRRELDVNSLCEVFGLTRSEATLSVSLAQCGNLKKAAAICKITTGSARQYMKRIFAKTNTGSQVELLSLLLHYPVL